MGKQWWGGVSGAQCLSVSCFSVSVLSVLSGCLIVWFTVFFVGLLACLLVCGVILLLPEGYVVANGYEVQLWWDQ